MYKNLHEFVELLERKGELIRIKSEVDPVYEITEIADRISKSKGGGKALLFENTGTDFPVLINMMGSDNRIALALGVDAVEEIGERINALLKQALSPMDSILDKMKVLPLLGEVSRWLPKTTRRRGACQQVVLEGENARLSLLPILKCWPHDGGRFVTLPLVNTIDPDSGVRNVGMYRMQVTDDYTTGMHWHLHKTGERHYNAYKRRGEIMPVSVCIGGDPAYTYAATAPMPDNMDEYLLAGFLRRKSVKLVKCITNDIYVPDDCDFVIEGYVDPSEDKFYEGPFGDHTGYYSLEDWYPYFHVTAITHRENAIYPATIVGVPPQEDAYIAKATETIFLEPIRLAIQPEVEDLYMPPEGVAHNLALISIRKTYAGQALKTASSMWGAGQMMFNKVMVVTPSEVELRDPKAIAPLMRSVNMEEDILESRGVLDVLDHSTQTMGVGGKLAFDLTKSRPVKDIKLPENIKTPSWAESLDLSYAQEWGVIVIFADPHAEVELGEFLSDIESTGVNYVVTVDKSASKLTASELLWFVLGNTEMTRDVGIRGGVMVIDARSKVTKQKPHPHRWPNIVTSSQETIELVDRRWSEYGLGDFVESPSERLKLLVFSEKAEV